MAGIGLGIAFLVFLAGTANAQEADQNDTPNVLLINVDDLGYGDVGAYGATKVETYGINPFGGQQPTFAYEGYGNPLNGGDNRGAQWTVYRFHSKSPVVFDESIRATIEHGHANHRSDTYYTVAYWYQTEPHGAFPELPPVDERMPQMVNTEGPTMGK